MSHDHNVADDLREQARYAFRGNAPKGEYLWTGRDTLLSTAHRLAADGSHFTRCRRSTHSGQIPLGVLVSTERAIEQVMTACPRCGFEVHTDG